MHPVNSATHKWRVAFGRVLPFWADTIICNLRGRSLNKIRSETNVPSPLKWYIPLPMEFEYSDYTKEPWFSIPYRHSYTLSQLISKVPRNRSAPAIPMPLWLHIFIACLDAILFYRSIYQEHSLLYDFTTDNVSLVPRTDAPPLIALIGLETVECWDNKNVEARRANMKSFYDFLRIIRGCVIQDRDIDGEIQHHLSGASSDTDHVMYTPDERKQLENLYRLSWRSPFGIPDEEYKKGNGQSELDWLKGTETYKVAAKYSSQMHGVQSRILRTFLEKEVRAQERAFRKEIHKKSLL